MQHARRTGTFELGDLPAEQGGVIRGARLVWESHGRLNAARDNVVLYPCSYGAQAPDLAWLIGPDGILDPERWFVVVPNMFSNGVSSSAADTPDFPALVTAADNVRAQQRLLAEAFGIDRLHAVYGFSMGAQQAYHWAALFPRQVARAIVVCGSARTADHNKVFLSSLMRTLEAAPEHVGNGRFSSEPKAALRAFGHIYAGWGLSQDFYRAGLYRTVLGAPDLQTFIQRDWVDRFSARRAANLYAQAMTWYHGDIAADPRYGGDLPAALAAIEAQVLLMPGETDLYFRVADNEAEMRHLRRGSLRPIPGIWGHRAGNPNGLPEETAFLRREVRAFLDI